ncbi:MAG: ABC transporter permease [Granulosicoccus sp.]
MSTQASVQPAGGAAPLRTTNSRSSINRSLPGLMRFMLADLRGSLSMRSLWVFCTCLFLGITLIAVCAGLLQLVRGGLDSQERLLFGGDVQVSDRQPISDEQLKWLEQQGDVSLLIELRTMMGTEQGQFTVVELQSVDDAYPLYGEIVFSPEKSVADAVALSSDGQWGAALDPVLAEQIGAAVGDTVFIGDLQMQVRAFITTQPDRSLRADVRGPPVIVAEQALTASGLLLPTSLVDYEYRVRLDGDINAWRDAARTAFPAANWEIQSVEERSEFVAERLNQVASVLLLIGCSTVLIGGLGVANSISAYLQTKYRSLATLQSLGARQSQVAFVYIGQVLLLGLFASVLGALAGILISWFGAFALADRLPVSTALSALLSPGGLSALFGVVCALTFSLPAIGRTLDMRPAVLIKGGSTSGGVISSAYRLATAFAVLLLVLVLVVLIPDARIGFYFVLGIALLLLMLEGMVQLVTSAARKLANSDWFEGRFAARMAVAGLYRPGTSLRPMLTSLGTALTLLVASTLVIAATVRTLSSTVPERTPSLAFYDIQNDQLDAFRQMVQSAPGYQSVSTTPLVLGRLRAVNGEELASSDNARRALEANDEHKFSYRTGGIDNTEVSRGTWWPADYQGKPLFAMEDREADDLGLKIGDQLRFDILGESVEAELVAIYEQARLETRFWLEGVFTNGVLDPFITRHIGTAFLDDGADVEAMNLIAASFPNVVSVRTAKALSSAREILGNAAKALAFIALVSLAASILVMASVVAVNRSRQVYEASVMHAVGSRMSDVIKTVVYEYILLGVVLIVFATLMGSVIGAIIITYWIELSVRGIWFTGLLVASLASILCLAFGALWMTRTLKASPASLLKNAFATT